MHHTRVAALIAAVQEAVAFAEDTYGDANIGLANRTTRSWVAAIQATRLTPPDEKAEAIRFHLNRAVDGMAESFSHALEIFCLANADPGDVLDNIRALALAPASIDAGPSDLSEDQVAELLASCAATARRRRRAKRL